MCRERLDIVKQQPVKIWFEFMQKKNSLWDERRGSSKLSYNRMPKKQNKTTSEKKRPTKTVLDGKESGDTSFATLTKVAAGSGKRKQQDGKVTVSLAPG